MSYAQRTILKQKWDEVQFEKSWKENGCWEVEWGYRKFFRNIVLKRKEIENNGVNLWPGENIKCIWQRGYFIIEVIIWYIRCSFSDECHENFRRQKSKEISTRTDLV